MACLEPPCSIFANYELTFLQHETIQGQPGQKLAKKGVLGIAAQ